MKIYINNKESETNAANLAALAEELNLPERGVAMAVNSSMVQRSEWESTAISDGANILIIKAACGG